MRYFFKLMVVIFTIILSGCSSTISEYLLKGDEAFQAENYEVALLNWENIITAKEAKNKNAEAFVYAKAGKAAMATSDFIKAKTYLTKAQSMGIESPEVLSGLAAIYKTQDNLTYEIITLEKLINVNPGDSILSKAHVQLFNAYVSSENWEKAVNLWPKLSSDSKETIEVLSNWLTVQKALNNNSQCNEISNAILQKDKKHIEATLWQATHYFERAEQLYQSEMAAYKANKTRAQYAILLKSLKKATADFKVSRDYFETLYKVSSDKKYAQYLANIYARLNNSKLSAHYQSLSN